MVNKKKPTNESTINYFFLFNCIAALGAAILTTAAIVALATMKAATIATATFGALAFSPVIPAIIALISLGCLVAYFGSATPTTTYTINPMYPRNNFFAPSLIPINNSIYNHHHTFNTTHGHEVVYQPTHGIISNTNHHGHTSFIHGHR